MPRSEVDAILTAWRSGAEEAAGFRNPAGPLFVGGSRAESQLAEADLAVGTNCSACSASRVAYCC
jgi:hypothetical protein